MRCCRLLAVGLILALGLTAWYGRAVAQRAADQPAPGTVPSPTRSALAPPVLPPELTNSRSEKAWSPSPIGAPAEVKWLPPAGPAVPASRPIVAPGVTSMGSPTAGPAPLALSDDSRAPRAPSPVAADAAPPDLTSGGVPSASALRAEGSGDTVYRKDGSQTDSVTPPGGGRAPALIADSTGGVLSNAQGNTALPLTPPPAVSGSGVDASADSPMPTTGSYSETAPLSGGQKPLSQAPDTRKFSGERLAGNTAMGAQSPTVYLEKLGPTTVTLGKPFAYEIVARNAGSVAVFNVHVEDELPPGARFQGSAPRPDVQGEHLLWNLGTMEPASERRIKVEIQPAAEGELMSRATVTFSASSTVMTRVTRPQLTLTITGTESALVGDPATFKIQVANVGTGPATNVVVHDNLPAGLWHDQGQHIDADIGTLGPGESRVLNLQTTAVKVGREINEAIVTADEGIRANAQAGVQITEAILALHKSGPHLRFLNRETDFTLEVSNAGTAPAKDVRVIDALPEGLEFISAGEQGSHEAATHKVTWKIGTLAPGEKRKLSLKVLAKSPGEQVSRALARAERGLEAKSEATVHVEGVPALHIEVVDQDDPLEVGKETTYEIRVVNQGTGQSTGLQLTAIVPNGMAAKSASGPTANRIQGQQVIFEPLAKLAPRADAPYRVRVVGQQAGDLRFKVQLMADHLTQPISEEESTRVYGD